MQIGNLLDVRKDGDGSPSRMFVFDAHDGERPLKVGLGLYLVAGLNGQPIWQAFELDPTHLEPKSVLRDQAAWKKILFPRVPTEELPKPQEIGLTSRLDLVEARGFKDLGTCSSGLPLALLNHHECGDCDVSWDSPWSCACDDDCPECGATTSPHESTFLGPDDPWTRTIYDLLPELPPRPEHSGPGL